jgi:AcrR family transcriptional regulator
LKKLPKQERSKETVEVMIEATIRIIESDGLAGVSTNRVAEVAGISVGSLYQYFPNKEALVEEVRARFSSRFHGELQALLGRLPGMPLRDALQAWLTTLVELHVESPGVHNAVGTGAPEALQAPLSIVIGRYLEAHSAEIRRPDLALAGRIVLDTAEALVHNTALREPELLKDPNWVAEVTDLLERYLVADAR